MPSSSTQLVHCFSTGVPSQLGADLDDNRQSNGNEQPATSFQMKVTTVTPTPGGRAEVKLRDRRRRESAPIIGMQDLDPAHPGYSYSQQVRGARRVSKCSQRAMLTSCLSEDSALEGMDPAGDVNTPKGSRRNFIELMMSSSPQVGYCVSPEASESIIIIIIHNCIVVYVNFTKLSSRHSS